MSMAVRMARLSIMSGLAAALVGVPATSRAQVPETPTFRTAVDLVPVSAIVKDGSGRPVLDLARHDFQVLEHGRPRPIVDFRVTDQGPVSLAILMDVSGSMHVAGQLAASRRAVEHLLSWVDPQKDELSLFSFDKDLRQEVAFTQDPERIRAGLLRIDAMGLTSLYDAISKTARTLADRPSPRRAVVVLTDGTDTSSRLTPSQVSTLASAIDVPVYVIAVLSPLDHPGTPHAVPSARQSPMATDLATLAQRTGGDLLMTSAPAHASLAARRIISELRHQYLLAFEANGQPGWHPLEITTRRARLTVRARAGYIAVGSAAASSPSQQAPAPTVALERSPASVTVLTR